MQGLKDQAEAAKQQLRGAADSVQEIEDVLLAAQAVASGRMQRETQYSSLCERFK